MSGWFACIFKGKLCIPFCFRFLQVSARAANSPRPKEALVVLLGYARTRSSFAESVKKCHSLDEKRKNKRLFSNRNSNKIELFCIVISDCLKLKVGVIYVFMIYYTYCNGFKKAVLYIFAMTTLKKKSAKHLFVSVRSFSRLEGQIELHLHS